MLKNVAAHRIPCSSAHAMSRRKRCFSLRCCSCLMWLKTGSTVELREKRQPVCIWAWTHAQSSRRYFAYGWYNFAAEAWRICCDGVVEVVPVVETVMFLPCKLRRGRWEVRMELCGVLSLCFSGSVFLDCCHDSEDEGTWVISKPLGGVPYSSDIILCNIKRSFILRSLTLDRRCKTSNALLLVNCFSDLRLPMLCAHGLERHVQKRSVPRNGRVTEVLSATLQKQLYSRARVIFRVCDCECWIPSISNLEFFDDGWWPSHKHRPPHGWWCSIYICVIWSLTLLSGQAIMLLCMQLYLPPVAIPLHEICFVCSI